MKIAGIVKSSLIDYPGKASTVIFLGGCNFRCGYCHNPDVVFFEGSRGASEHEGKQTNGIDLQDFFDFLEKRRRFLDAVCISGGEPTIWPELYDLIRRIKERGLAVKLDTNGSNPELLSRLLSAGMPDYVAMDIKGPLRKYPEITGRCAGKTQDVQESSRLLRDGDCPYEFRTTVCRELLSEGDLREMIGEHPGAVRWFLQSYRDSGKQIDMAGSYTAYTREEMEGMGARLCVSVR